MSVTVDFISHADVEIDPDIPVTEWGLSERGQARHRRQAEAMLAAPPDVIRCSTEVKAKEAARILSEVTGAPCHDDARLGENDRSATGYLPKAAFEAAASAFFAAPCQSFRGWERAVDAQARIVTAMTEICRGSGARHIAIVSHGGVGTLLLCHVKGVPIGRQHDQPGQGHVFRFDWPDLTLHHGWRDIAPD